MSFVPLVVFGVAVGLLAIVLDVVKVPVPYPGVGFEIEQIQARHLPLNASALEGVYSPNTALQSSKKVLVGKAHGVETVSLGRGGKVVYLPDKYGRVFQGRVTEDENGVVDVRFDESRPLLVNLGAGRPLGSLVDENGDLLVCDSLKGLLKVGIASNSLEILTTQVSKSSPKDPGSPIRFANDLDIGEDGTIYFSDSTSIPPALNDKGFYDSLHSFIMTVVQGKGTGRLLSYNPATKETVVLTSGIWFANGVALSQDESFVAVVETATFKIYKYFLKGPKAGKREVLIENLPGYPDGIARASDGNIWVAIAAPPFALLKGLEYRALRAIVGYAPASLKPKPGKWGVVLKVSPDGKVVDKLMDPDGGFISHVSGLQEGDGKLFMGNLVGDYVSVFDLGLLNQE